MTTKPLTQITLFTMGRENLEKRILKAHADLADTDSVVQYLVAVLIRQCLCVSDFSGMCSELLREIFLQETPTDVLRKFCPLFRTVFRDDEEWVQVTSRLYKNAKEYHRYNNRLSDSKKYLFENTTPVEALEGQQYKLVSTFEDAVGKIHTWSLREADPHASAMKIDAVLELLSSLTIFEKNDVRRFVKLENSEIDNCTRYLKIKKGEIVENAEAPSKSELGGATMDLLSMSDQEKLELVKQLLPEGIILTDMRAEERRKKQAENAAPKTEKESTVNECRPLTAKEQPKTERKKDSVSEPSMVLSAEKKPSIDFRKPKSEKQKDRERRDELYKQTKKGKIHSRKKKKR